MHAPEMKHVIVKRREELQEIDLKTQSNTREFKELLKTLLWKDFIFLLMVFFCTDFERS